jgi:hypothetical protein
MATPSERYRPSHRRFPESLPAIEYGSGDIVRKADQEGDISFRGRRLRLGRAFRGEPISVRPTTADGVFSIHFCTHQLGTVDLREPDVWACGHVDIAAEVAPCSSAADAIPTCQQAQQQQQPLDNRP